MSEARTSREVLWAAAAIYAIGAIAWPGEAFAYVDPGSGSVIVTAVLGAIAAVGYTFRKYFYKARKFLTSRDKK